MHTTLKKNINRKAECNLEQANKLQQTWSFAQSFSNSAKGYGDGKFAWGIFLSGGGNLTRSDFGDSNLFQSQKKHSVNVER